MTVNELSIRKDCAKQRNIVTKQVTYFAVYKSTVLYMWPYRTATKAIAHTKRNRNKYEKRIERWNLKGAEFREKLLARYADALKKKQQRLTKDKKTLVWAKNNPNFKEVSKEETIKRIENEIITRKQ